MVYFHKQGNTFYQRDNVPDIQDNLPAGTYVLKRNPQTMEFYYEQIDPFEIPSKVYGDQTTNKDRIITTFFSRSAATGVLLVGDKGSGKTLLAKDIAVTLQTKHDIPTIVINAPYSGDEFNTFIQEMSQPCCILFDEFEKTYGETSQEEILTLLDGVYPTKKLFILTANDAWRVDRHMMNRPGRIFYMIEFKTLGASFIREYATENLINKNHIDGVMAISGIFTKFNFDMLKALIEEMNRFDETAADAIRFLNARPEFDEGKSDYEITLTVNGKTLSPVVFEDERNIWKGMLMKDYIKIPFWSNSDKMVSEREEFANHYSDHMSSPYRSNISLSSLSAEEQKLMKIIEDSEEWSYTASGFSAKNDLVKVDEGTFYFKNSIGDELVMKKIVADDATPWHRRM